MPLFKSGATVTLDFSGVRLVNSSFSNALFGNLFLRFGETALGMVAIEHARPIVRSEIKSGIAYGIRLFRQRETALSCGVQVQVAAINAAPAAPG